MSDDQTVPTNNDAPEEAKPVEENTGATEETTEATPEAK